MPQCDVCASTAHRTGSHRTLELMYELEPCTVVGEKPIDVSIMAARLQLYAPRFSELTPTRRPVVVRQWAFEQNGVVRKVIGVFFEENDASESLRTEVEGLPTP